MKDNILTVLKSKVFKVTLVCATLILVATATVWVVGGMRAIDYALGHANVTKDQVSHIRFEFEVERFIPEYQVSWYQDKREVEYTVHAFTGELLEIDRD